MRLSVAAGVATMSVSIMLYPLFDGGAWLWASLGVVLAVFAASWLSGRLSLPSWAAPLAGVVAVLLLLNATFAGHKAWAVVIPTKDSVVYLAKLLATGWTDIQRFAAPVPANRGITLLTAAGVGLIAILIDLFAARMRRAALAGLPMLALATVPATIMAEPISWPAFILAALGFTNLLIADGRERVGHWGRAVLVRRTRAATTQTIRDNADTRGLRLSGKRIGFAAIGMAVLLPALLPPMEPVSFFTFGVGGNGKGGKGNSISIPNPIANLKGQLDLPEKRTVLTYTASDDKPRYLRIYSLDLFDGEKFDMTPPTGSPENKVENGPLPWPAGLSRATGITNSTTTIKISDEIARLNFLPLPYAPRQIEADGDWRADVGTLMVFSTKEEASGLEYKVSTTEPNATPALLENLPSQGRPTIDPRYLKLPDLPDEIKKLAFDQTSGAKTQYEVAVKLQEFFTRRGQFQYSLQTRGHGTSALKDFLLSSRAGYCEQFSAAFAVLARVLGIPSRVSIGYTGGNRVDNRWVVGTNDSHAWPELYFEGVGWLAFEPTPAGSIGQGSARIPPYSLPQPKETGSAAEPTPGATTDSAGNPINGPDGLRPNARQLEDREGRLLGLDGLPVDQSMPLIAKIGLGAAGLLLLLLVPAVIRLFTRSRRVRVLGWKVAGAPSGEVRATLGSSPPVAAAWAELDDVLCDYGMARQSSETPRALSRRLIEQYEFDAESAASIAAISSAVERTLFAREPGEIGSLKKDLRRVRRALASAVTRGRRIRALLLPPSTLLRIRRMGEGLLDGFDRLENIRFRFSRAAQKSS